MMITSYNNKISNRGFALIASLSIMTLLVMIAVGMLSLSSIEHRQASSATHQAEARANARMALMIALGELQEAAGSDQRITANAAILDTDSDSPVEQSQLLGVWYSIGANNDDVNSGVTNTSDLTGLATAYRASYTGKTRGDRFRKWLVSGESVDIENIDFPKSKAAADAVALIGAQTLGEQNEASLPLELQNKLVKAGLIKTLKNEQATGGYAWAVMGENLKARVNLSPVTGNGGDSERIGQRAGSSLNAIQVMNDATYTFGDKFIDYAGELSPSLEKATSVQSLRLAGSNANVVSDQELGMFYSDLSISSSGLLTDAKWGGWKKDLSLLAELSSLPSKLGLSADPTAQVFTGSGDTMTHGPYWEDLWNYTRSYKPFAQGGLVEWNSSTPYYSVGPDWNSTVTRRGWQMRMPVLSKYMWVISFIGKSATPPATGSQLVMIAQPIIELWNPFSLPLKMPTDSKYNLELVTLPIKLNPYQNGTSLIGADKPIYWIFREGANTGPMAIYSVDFTGELAMQPGENTLYSDQSEIPQASDTGNFILTKGLNVQGGVRFENIGHGGKPVLIADTSKPITIEYTRDVSRTFHSRTFFSDQIGASGALHSELLPYKAQNSIFNRLPRAGNSFNLKATATPSLIYGAIMKTEIPISKSEPPLLGEQPTQSESVKFSHHLNSALSIGRSYIGPNGGENGIPEMLEASPFAYMSRRLSSYSNLPISLSGTGNGYQGREVGPDGQAHMPTRELPIQPLISMAQLQHASLGDYHVAWDFNTTTTAKLENGHLVSHPHVGFAFGNSYASPFVNGELIEALNSKSPMGQRDKVGTTETVDLDDNLLSGFTTTLHDKSWKANEALWDEWFLSSVGDWTNPLVAQPRNKAAILNDFAVKNKPLPNARYTPDVNNAATAETDINADDGYTKLARYISNQGSFNVNSTSKYAWKAVLGGLDRKTADLIYLDKLSGNIVKDTDASNNDSYAFSRFTLPNGQSTASTGTSNEERQGRYLGARKLDDTELDLLADKIVEEVKLRGPFLSLSEFMNRRLVSGNDDLAKRGALQSAIDKAQLNLGVESDNNGSSSNNSIDVSDLAGTYINPDALKSYDGSGYNGPLHTVTGAPSYLSQADVLMPIAPSLTVRCDTFTIRSYGESLDRKGNVAAKAWCEAVVKRQPEYVDSSDATDKQIVDLDGEISPINTINHKYGRKMEIVSFRWLSADEI